MYIRLVTGPIKHPDSRLINRTSVVHPYGTYTCNPVHRCDDNASKIGDKMIYASTKDSVKKAFSGLGVEFQANDTGDMDYDTFAAEVERKA